MIFRDYRRSRRNISVLPHSKNGRPLRDIQQSILTLDIMSVEAENKRNNETPLGQKNQQENTININEEDLEDLR